MESMLQMAESYLATASNNGMLDIAIWVAVVFVSFWVLSRTLRMVKRKKAGQRRVERNAMKATPKDIRDLRKMREAGARY